MTGVRSRRGQFCLALVREPGGAPGFRPARKSTALPTRLTATPRSTDLTIKRLPLGCAERTLTATAHGFLRLFGHAPTGLGRRTARGWHRRTIWRATQRDGM